MDSAREASDVRSPKRHAVTPTDASRAAACAVAALDEAIWISIIEFLPIPKDLHANECKTYDDYKAYDASAAEVATTWQTLLGLRVVSRKLSALLHPRENAALWRHLVLQSFDFSCSGSLNLENYNDDHDLEDPEDDADDQDQEEGEEDPQRVAMRGWYQDMPTDYLEEDLIHWSKIGIYHRPSQYGFLTSLQQQPPEGAWPELEDAFTLFGDIVRLLQLPHGRCMEAGGEGGDRTVKYVAAPTEAGPSSRYYRFLVMKTLGYVPHFWHHGKGIGKEWKGFSEPESQEAAIAKQLCDEKGGDDTSNEGFIDDDDAFDFPGCTVGHAKRLFHHVRQHCRDWRSVCCNEGSDGTTPVFFVGESTAAPHRWTGYMGEKTWT